MEKRQLAQHNNLIRANLHFSPIESRIFTLMLAATNKDDTDVKSIQIHIDDIFGKKKRGGSDYEALVEAVNDLFGKSINLLKIDTDGGKGKKNDFHKIRLVQEMKFEEGTGYVTGMFSEKVRDYVIHLRKEFAMAELENLMKMKKPYSQRCYWLMKSFQSLGGVELELKDFKKKIGVIEIHSDPKTGQEYEKELYPRFYDFNKQVLIPVMKEINKYMMVEYELKLKGRIPVSIEFKIPKPVKIESRKPEPQPPKLNMNKPVLPNGSAKYSPPKFASKEGPQGKRLNDPNARTLDGLKAVDLLPEEIDFFMKNIDWGQIRSVTTKIVMASYRAKIDKREEALQELKALLPEKLQGAFSE